MQLAPQHHLVVRARCLLLVVEAPQGGRLPVAPAPQKAVSCQAMLRSGSTKASLPHRHGCQHTTFNGLTVYVLDASEARDVCITCAHEKLRTLVKSAL